MSHLAAFLIARIQEDRSLARAATDYGHGWAPEGAHEVWANEDDPEEGTLVASGCPEIDRNHIIRWDPARALIECEAKRRIVEHTLRLQNGIRLSDGLSVGNTDDAVLRLLALPYADHPDYREEWRP